MLLAKASSVDIIKGFTVPEMADICGQLEVLAPQIDDDALRFQAYQRLRGFCGAAGKMERTQLYINHLLELADRLENPVFHYSVLQAAGMLNLQIGHLSVASHYFQQATALHREESENFTLVPFGHGTSTQSNLAFTQWLVGYPDQAYSNAAEAVIFAKHSGNPIQISVAIFFACLVYRYMRVAGAGNRTSGEMLALDAKYGFPLNKASGLVAQGWVWAQQGRLGEGIAQMRAGIDQMIAMHHTMFQTHRLAWLAEAQMQAGLWEDAAATLDEGLAMAEQSGQRSNDAELHRLQGEWLVQHQRWSAAEASFDRAIEVARTQEAKSFELRAVMSLCRLWQRQGRRAEAHAWLAEIYGWFTEGFDTADLQAARALLVALT